MIRENINKLIEEITRNHPQEDIFEAKKDFQKFSGEIFEDDKSFESRMGSFLEWYTFDRICPGSTSTPLEQYLENHSTHSEYKELAEAISQGIHGLFVAKKIKNDYVIVVDVMDDKNTRFRKIRVPFFSTRTIFLRDVSFPIGDSIFLPIISVITRNLLSDLSYPK